MADLKDRKAKQTAAKPTTKAVKQIVGKKEKYPVNVVFDGDQEDAIRKRAKDLGIGVATYIKMVVAKDLNGVD